jgi:hypothetical protein
LVLTKRGLETLREHAQVAPDQALYARFVKPHEIRHDAAIYRMFQAERARIERESGQVRRVVLDFELKQRVYRPLAHAKGLSATEYALAQERIADANGLKVVNGKIPLPDLRVEFETASGDAGRVDLELATSHYHGPALQAKAQAGFTFYVADGSGDRLSRVLEERDITVAILSL